MSSTSMPGPADPDEIKADIEATRAQLGETLDELSSRLDVPARAKERVHRAQEGALDLYLENPPAVMGGAVAAVVLLALLAWRRGRRRRRRRQQ